jgi:hypothetical protein
MQTWSVYDFKDLNFLFIVSNLNTSSTLRTKQKLLIISSYIVTFIKFHGYVWKFTTILMLDYK